MTIVASRHLTNSDVCFVGIGAPSAACNLARLTHAPDIVLIYESGTLEARPDILPLSIGDGVLCDAALATVSVVEIFDYWLQGGRITKGFISGAQIDRFANINSTVIGDYGTPTTRLPGAGGAPEIAAHCSETLIMAKHIRRTFVECVDFVTTYGHGSGGTSRRDLGLTTAGPARVVTDLCVMEPDPKTKELVVCSLHDGVTREDVADATSWDVRFHEDVQTTEPAMNDELAALRGLNQRTQDAHLRTVI